MSNFKNILIKTISESIINEIGESNIPPLDFKTTSPLHYFFYIEIDGENVVVDVNFDKFEIGSDEWKYCFSPTLRNFNTYYNVGYDVGGDNNQYIKTSIKYLLRILSTVTFIVKDFISKNNPDCLYIEGSDKDGVGGEKQKSNTYGAYILKQLKTIEGYSSITKNDGYNVYKTKK